MSSAGILSYTDLCGPGMCVRDREELRARIERCTSAREHVEREKRGRAAGGRRAARGAMGTPEVCASVKRDLQIDLLRSTRRPTTRIP